MSPRATSPVAWWTDRYDAKPLSTLVGDLEDLSEDERDLVDQIVRTKYHGDFVPSSSLTTAELRAALRLMRRGVLFATFHITPSIGTAFFQRLKGKAK